MSEKIGEIMETKTILIVDDALTNRVLLKRYLEDDYNIIEAENGQRAIDIFIIFSTTLHCIMYNGLYPYFLNDIVLNLPFYISFQNHFHPLVQPKPLYCSLY